jgi:hypothetical protein
MKMENKVTITLEEYASLLVKAERIDVIERMLAQDKYVSTSDIRNVVGIPEKGESNG